MIVRCDSMKKIIKNPIFTFILGSLIFSGVTYAATISANNVSYDNINSGLKDSNNNIVNNVQDAIDALYNKANEGIPTYYKDLSTPVSVTANDLLNGKTAYNNDGTIVTGNIPTYSGTSTFTPTRSQQTIETNGKYMNGDITIESIPSTYKNLIVSSDFTASDLLTGKRAYNSTGELIEGTHVEQCETGNYHHAINTQVNISLSYKPSIFSLSTVVGNIFSIEYNSNTSNVVKEWEYSTTNASSSRLYSSSNIGSRWIVDNNGLHSSLNSSDGWVIHEYDINYIACR